MWQSNLEGSDHSSSLGGGKLICTASKERMKHLFSKMGIDFNTQVIVFPKTDSFNGRAFLYDWLMTASITKECPHDYDMPRGYQKRYAVPSYTAYQRKWNEDTKQWEEWTVSLLDYMQDHSGQVPTSVLSMDYVHVISEIQVKGWPEADQDGLFITNMHDNKCLMYSLPFHLLTSSWNILRISLGHVIELFMCQLQTSGMEKFARYCLHLLSSGIVPSCSIPKDFNCYSHEKLGGSTTSQKPFIQHQTSFGIPVGEWEIIFRCWALLESTYLVYVECMTPDKCHTFLKKHIPLAHDLSTNHIMAIACLVGLFCNQEMAWDAYIPLTLVKAAKKKVYGDNLDVTNSNILWLATEQVARAIGYNKLEGEHKFCESLQDAPNPDCHLKDQTYTWISHLNDNDDSVFELGVDGNHNQIWSQSPRQDLNWLLHMSLSDAHPAIHLWWDYPFDRTESLVCFIEECEHNSIDPFQLLYCGSNKASKYTPRGHKNEKLH